MKVIPSRGERVLRAAYRLLLSAYPSEFRAAFGEEMEAVFAEAVRAASERGGWAAVAALLREYGQAPGQIVRQHWSASRSPRLALSVPSAETTMTTQRSTRIWSVFGAILILAALGLWLMTVAGWGLEFGLTFPGLLVALPVVGLVAWLAGAHLLRVSTGVWLVAGLGCAAGLVWPTSSLVGSVLHVWPAWVRLGIFALPVASTVVAAMLLGRGLIHWPTRARWLAGLCFGLSALVLAQVLHNLFWLLLWDSTDDPLGFLWLIPIGLAGMFGGALLSRLLGLSCWAAIYSLLVAGALAGLMLGVHQLDFGQLTSARAERVAAAVRAYHAREGAYPQDLRQLAPRYLLTVPGPVVINGQPWCYLSGEGYFQLGYVYRIHWSSPDLLVNLYAAEGGSEPRPEFCGAELAALDQQAAEVTSGWTWPVSEEGVLARLKPGMSRVEVLQGMYEVWHRDGCPPQQAPVDGQYAYTDLFWMGAQNVRKATVIAVHYTWDAAGRVWIVRAAEAAPRSQLYERYQRCSTLDLTPLRGE